MATETIDQLAERFRILPEQAREVFARSADDTVEDGAARARQLAAARLTRRSGRLIESIHARTGEAPGVVGGEGVPWFSVQEQGGTVKPHGAFLAVPLDGTTVASPRDLPGARFVPDARGFTVLDASGVPRFVLRRSVTIKPKRFTLEGFSTALQALPARLTERTTALLEGARG